MLRLLPQPCYKNYGAHVKNISTLHVHGVVRIPVQISLFTTCNLRTGLRRFIFLFFFLYVSTARNISTYAMFCPFVNVQANCRCVCFLYSFFYAAVATNLLRNTLPGEYARIASAADGQIDRDGLSRWTIVGRRPRSIIGTRENINPIRIVGRTHVYTRAQKRAVCIPRNWPERISYYFAPNTSIEI